MNTELEARLFRHLKQQQDAKGFTLIELLVVIIIIGILSAIALPSFLSQASKSKQSEAKVYVGACLKGQQGYFIEKSEFSNAIADLEIGIRTDTTIYTYSTIATNNGDLNDNGVCKARAKNVSLRGYSGKVALAQIGGNDTTTVVILCEANIPGAVDPTDPIDGQNCAADQTQL